MFTHTLLSPRPSALQAPTAAGQHPGLINGADGIVRRSRSPATVTRALPKALRAMAHHASAVRPAPSVQSPAQSSHPVRRGAPAHAYYYIAVVCSVLRPTPRSGAGMCRISFSTRLPSFFPIPAAAARKHPCTRFRKRSWSRHRICRVLRSGK